MGLIIAAGGELIRLAGLASLCVVHQVVRRANGRTLQRGLKTGSTTV